MTIRPGLPADGPGLERLYRAAFPREDLVPLLRGLLAMAPPALSFVATGAEVVTGHVAFTLCGIGEAPRAGDVGAEGPPGHGTAALLAPLAVAPEAQRRGLGGALVRHGIAALGDMGVARVLVLGDPGYYGRFGFAPEIAVEPPYPLPEAWRDAWQGLALPGDAPPPRGVLRVPAPWRRPHLWGA